MTPEEAQELREALDTGAEIFPDEEYEAVATVAGLHYEYAVQVGMDGKYSYAFMADTGRFSFGPLALADWWQTYGEADDLVADLKKVNPHTTACVVRRLAGDPEVATE